MDKDRGQGGGWEEVRPLPWGCGGWRQVMGQGHGSRGRDGPSSPRHSLPAPTSQQMLPRVLLKYVDVRTSE